MFGDDRPSAGIGEGVVGEEEGVEREGDGHGKEDADGAGVGEGIEEGGGEKEHSWK